MPPGPLLEPLPRQKRRATFIVLVLLFVFSLPFLYLYATGYRFEFGERTNLISTGGIYVAAERTGAEIFIDDELVRETRVFRKAFYAQSLEPGTHRVHVQKEGHHTWVKELPVEPHIVTEAQAFNLPLVPQVRVISRWQSATGSPVIFGEFPLVASSTNEYIATSTKKRPELFFDEDEEYPSLLAYVSTSSATSTIPLREQIVREINTLLATKTATGTEELATTTKIQNGVMLSEGGEDVYARWVGPREEMPYYYCAGDFPRYSTSTEGALLSTFEEARLLAEVNDTDEELVHPVQSLPEDLECEPVIRLDRKWQQVNSFDFFPGSTDLVLLSLEGGIYLVEIDDRAWQNVQPVLEGDGLDMRVENGQIYVYDGELIYQIILES